MVVAVSTHAQTVAKTVASTISEPLESSCAHHSGIVDQSRQAHLPLSFGLADAPSVAHGYVATPAHNGEAISRDLAHTLAYKVLQMSIFLNIELMMPDFKPTWIFHLVGKILEGKMAMPFLNLAQAITKPSMNEDLAKLQTNLAAEAITLFDENSLHQIEPSPPFDALLATKVTYLTNIATRCAQEC